jgi:CDP-4-dehydro-6-deoxyglucose reductase
LAHIEQLSSSVIKVLLRLPPDADFRYYPGQYINVTAKRGIRRSYSLANADLSDKIIELHIRSVEGGSMSAYWFQEARQNDLLRFTGPHGTFFLRDTGGRDLFFLATGTGIAPVKAMLESLARSDGDQRPNSVTVFWGNRHLQDWYINLHDVPGHFVYVPVQSRPSTCWTGATGHVQDVLLSAKPNLSNAIVYACGSDAMIRGAKSLLTTAGLEASRFHSDAFVSSGPV